MKRKFKILIGSVLAITIINTILLAFILTNLRGVNHIPTENATSAQATTLQNSIDNLTSKVTTLQQSSVTPVTCTGSFYQSLYGSGSVFGSSSSMNISGTNPIRLTCS